MPRYGTSIHDQWTPKLLMNSLSFHEIHSVEYSFTRQHRHKTKVFIMKPMSRFTYFDYRTFLLGYGRSLLLAIDNEDKFLNELKQHILSGALTFHDNSV